MARIETTPVVRFTLYTLLVYVVVMLLLILVRFLRIFPLTQHPAKKAAVVSVIGLTNAGRVHNELSSS